MKMNKELKGLNVLVFFDAFKRKMQGQELIPLRNELLMSLEVNEFFVIGMSEKDIEKAISLNDRKSIGEKLYRCISISKAESPSEFRCDVKFISHHYIIQDTFQNQYKIFKNIFLYHIQTIDKLTDMVKIKIDILGNVSL